MVIAGPSNFVPRFVNSLVIGFGSTFLAVCFGTIVGLRRSRDSACRCRRSAVLHPVDADDAADRGRDPDLSDVPHLGLTDTKLGMILLYTAVNVSLAVWLLKGFIDEIPREYEEAAMVDGYTRLQAFVKVVLPQATTGIAATAIFCLIFAWNEYAFAVLLTSGDAQTAPPFIPIIIGEGGQDWPAVAAGDHAVFHPDPVFHHPAAQASACAASPSGRCANDHGDRSFRFEMAALAAPRLREIIAMALIGLGVVMLMQPFLLISTAIRLSRSWPARWLRDRQPFSGLAERLMKPIHRLSFRDALRPAIAGRSAGPETIAPAVVMDCGLAGAALRAPRNDDGFLRN